MSTPIATDTLLPHRILTHAVHRPDAVAVIADDRTWTYGQLVGYAARVAAVLRQRGAGPDRVIGLACPRSVDGLVGMLGIALAGAAHVYLDPTWPIRTLRRMADQCQTPQILTDDTGATDGTGDDPAARLGLPALDLADILTLGWTSAPPQPQARRQDLAYVVYTSGSTGTRKGVAVEHAGVANMAVALADLFGVVAGTRVAQFAAWSWDASACEIWMTLAAGATIVLVPQELRTGGPELAAFLRAERVQVATLPPSLLAALPDTDLPHLHTLAAVGEPCPPELVDRWATGGRAFFNGYGLTETTVAVSVARCRPGQPVTIGTPLPGVLVRVVDDHDTPMPAGQPGHLLVGGIGLARGYLTDPSPDRPGTRVIDPGGPFFTDQTGTRWYRTGDIVTREADGSLRFVRRADSQVQIHGHRVEPAEITTAIRSDPRVHQCAITKVGGQLVAYVSADPPLTATELTDLLTQQLPPPVVPIVHLVDNWPETVDGRTDMDALTDITRAVAATHPAPDLADDPVLADVLALVRAILRRDDIGVDDDFFAVGGHSLLAAELSVRIDARFGASVPVRQVIDHPTPRRLAALVQPATAVR